MQQWWQQTFGAHEPWIHTTVAFTAFAILCTGLIFFRKGKVLSVTERTLQKKFLVFMTLTVVFFGLCTYILVGPRS